MRLAIVGLGRMGAGYPDAGGVPRSHLAAALATPGVTVTALVDPDAARRAEAGTQAPDAALFTDVSDMQHGFVDAVIDARPPRDRAGLVRAARRLGARAVVFEKPLAETMEDALATARTAAESGLTARVNFHRRFDARFVAARAALGERPVTVAAHYAKGLRNYGSHMIDLILHWMGPIEAVRAVGDRFGDDDPSIGFDLRFTDGRMGTMRALETDFDLFEATFFTTEARLDIRNGGTHMTLARAVGDLVYPGYRHLAAEALTGDGTAVAGLMELHAGLAAHLDTGAPLEGATVEDALAGMAVIEAVRRSHADGCSWQNARPAPFNA